MKALSVFALLTVAFWLLALRENGLGKILWGIFLVVTVVLYVIERRKATGSARPNSGRMG